MNEPSEFLRDTISQLHLAANIGAQASPSAEETRAILDELERLQGFERAWSREVDAYAKLVRGVDSELDEQADLIAALLEQLKQTVNALTHWALRWGDPQGVTSQMMINARAMIAKADAYLQYYREHVKGVISDAD